MRNAIRGRWARWLAALWGCGLLFAAPPAAALSVTLNPVSNSSYLIVRADNDGGSLDTQIMSDLSFPFADSHTAFSGPVATSTTSYDFSDSGFVITIDDHQRPANLDAMAFSSGQIHFSVDETAQYMISGLYEAQNPPEARVHFGVELRDLVSDEVLYTTFLESRSTPDETFEIGVGGGDTTDFEFGALTGQLEAGREYRFIYTVSIQAPVAPTGAASATGVVQVALVPEPTAVPSLSPTGISLLGGLIFVIAIGELAEQRRRRAG